MIVSQNKDIEEQARSLAASNRDEDPDIAQVLWFPHEQEVRLVLVNPQIPIVPGETRVLPFYFCSEPETGATATPGIALIRPEEVGHLMLPPDWGTWNDAVEL